MIDYRLSTIIKFILKLLNQVFKNPGIYWILAFFLINLLIPVRGGTSPRARLATMMSLAENRSFRIDDYVHITMDWSKTPDGHYFANKAPGPALYGFAVSQIFELPLHLITGSAETRKEIRFKYHALFLKFLSLLLQVLPFSILALILFKWLNEIKISFMAQQITCLALLFGTTASMYMNTFAGHGMTAVFVLAMAIALIRKKPLLLGFFSGNAVLCEFSAIIIVSFGFLSLVLSQRPFFKNITRFLIGFLPMIFIFAYYNYHYFGNPLSTSLGFTNPGFLYLDHNPVNLWGLFSVPDPVVFLKLLFGPSRGILWTQGWILALIIMLKGKLHARRELPVLLIFAGPPLLILLLLNSSFGDWAAGNSPGPRYLSGVLPLFSIILGLVYDRLPKSHRGIVWALVLSSVLLFILAYSSKILVTNRPLWPFYFSQFTDKIFFDLMKTNFALIILILLLPTIKTFRDRKKACF